MSGKIGDLTGEELLDKLVGAVAIRQHDHIPESTLNEYAVQATLAKTELLRRLSAAPQVQGDKWAAEAFVMLAGLKEAVQWELAPAIMKEIGRLVESYTPAAAAPSVAQARCPTCLKDNLSWGGQIVYCKCGAQFHVRNISDFYRFFSSPSAPQEPICKCPAECGCGHYVKESK